MNKPWLIWLLSTFCAVLIFGAMGAITHHTLELEKKSELAYSKAQLEEKVRLAMWRMDTMAAGILAEENNRPAWHFQSSTPPTEQLTSNPIPQVISPLNVVLPTNVKLHFEAQGNKLTTPQQNRWSNGKQAQSLWAQQGQKLSKDVSVNWGALNQLLIKNRTFAGWQADRNTTIQQDDNNLGLLNAIARRSTTRPQIAEKEINKASQQRNTNPQAVVGNSGAYQGSYNKAEKHRRQEIVGKTLRKGNQSNQKQKKPSKPLPKSNPKSAATKEPINQNKLPAGPVPDDPILDKHLQAVLSGNGGLSQPGIYFTPMRPVWIGRELILVREVSDGKSSRLQGVWLDAVTVRADLLENIKDLLADAKLEPIKQSTRVLLGDVPDPHADDPMVLASLPWKLSPGEIAQPASLGWTTMRKTLAVAWVGALFAALAAIVLLRGVVKLSERRASFVSSVTHELRTPLTTFGLYSDMLAEGMVQDPEKKQEYLETLRRESGRLTHLVENVLAYSRIEKGSARARTETIVAGELVERMSDRLSSRAEEAGMIWQQSLPDELTDRELTIDTTAVEQIVFNLVDNAAKYAAEQGTTIRLELAERGDKTILRISDDGPGINPREHRRLFRAFHKSAQEAAHSKPGVGLGLALSRRLARAMGGDLLIAQIEQGACFELVVP